MSDQGITYKRIDCIGIYRDGSLVAIEAQNGHIERWATKPCDRKTSMEIFGVDKVQ